MESVDSGDNTEGVKGVVLFSFSVTGSFYLERSFPVHAVFPATPFHQKVKERMYDFDYFGCIIIGRLSLYLLFMLEKHVFCHLSKKNYFQ